MLTTWEQDIADGFKLEIDSARTWLTGDETNANIGRTRIWCARRLATMVAKHLGCSETEFLTACGVSPEGVV